MPPYQRTKDTRVYSLSGQYSTLFVSTGYYILAQKDDDRGHNKRNVLVIYPEYDQGCIQGVMQKMLQQVLVHIQKICNNQARYSQICSSISYTGHSGFFPQFLCCSHVHFMSRSIDISQEPIDDLASKLINHGKEGKEKKISVDAKCNKNCGEKSVLQGALKEKQYFFGNPRSKTKQHISTCYRSLVDASRGLVVVGKT